MFMANHVGAENFHLVGKLRPTIPLGLISCVLCHTERQKKSQLFHFDVIAFYRWPVKILLLFSFLLFLKLSLFFSFLADPFFVALDAFFHCFSVTDLRVVAVEDGPNGYEGDDSHDDCGTAPRQEPQDSSGIGISTDHYRFVPFRSVRPSMDRWMDGYSNNGKEVGNSQIFPVCLMEDRVFFYDIAGDVIIVRYSQYRWWR